MDQIIEDIQKQSLLIPNGTVGKAYLGRIDFETLGWVGKVSVHELDGAEATGLTYDAESNSIAGVPTASGEFILVFRFKLNTEENTTEWHTKNLTLTINPDPKTLWKNEPSDPAGLYCKPDDALSAGQLGDRSFVVASKRGRSHAHVGKYRDDDFAYAHFEECGWSAVAVADGAGSAKYSRKGSAMACEGVISFFRNKLNDSFSAEFDTIINQYYAGSNEAAKTALNSTITEMMSKAAWGIYQELSTFAKENELEVKDLHTTLIFTLFKKFAFGYVLLSFGVGDCPIALVNKEMTEVTLMNWLDVGEYGGGTRFITMPEVFTSEKFYTRFRFRIVPDFSYLFMMTDGVYDAKFVVEANLEKIEYWQQFLADLAGNNDELTAVVFDAGNKEIGQQLTAWLDFWSPGNHDDRTLAIVF